MTDRFEKIQMAHECERSSRHPARMRIRWVLFLCAIGMLIAAPQIAATEDILHLTKVINQPFGGSQSPDDARAAGVAKGKAEALERAGTYVESRTLVEDFVLKKDETLALTAGVLNTEIVSQENYATENGFGMILTLKVEVDKAVLDNRLKQIQSDRVLLRKYQELQKREASLLARIKQLEAVSNKEQPVGAIAFEKAQQYRSVIQALPAVDLNRQALTLWENGRFGDPQRALELLNEALVLDPQNATTINNRGVALYTMGKRSKALSDFDLALKLSPDYADAYNNRGVVQMALQNYAAAEKDFGRVIDLAPTRVDAYINRGVARKNLLRYAAALEDYKRALMIDPHLARYKVEPNSARLDYHELERICDKARRACAMDMCQSWEYLKKKALCQ